MKTLIIFGFLFLQNISFAQTPSTSTNYSILGKGIMNKSTGDSIALACVEFDSKVEPQCKTLSFVYFDAKSFIAYEIGGRYSVIGENLSDASKLAAKDLKKKIKVELKNNFKKNSTAGILTASGIILAGGAATVALNSFLPVLPAIGLWYFINNNEMDPAFLDPRGYIVSTFLVVRDGALGNAVLDQDGWNWSVKPKKVSHHRFERVMKALN